MKTSFLSKRFLAGCLLLFLLTGCGGVSGEKVDSADSIVGTWHRIGGGHENYCRFSDDGTWTCYSDLDNVLTGNEFNLFYGEYWFEGTRYLDRITESRGGTSTVLAECSEAGEYEIYIQPSGNLKYALIEDACMERFTSLAGAGSVYEGEIEWERVPSE